MKLSDVVFGSRIRILALELLLTAALGVGCVSLDKPSKVQSCANAGNCSDDPKQQSGPDAKDAVQSGPDLAKADKPTAKDDVDNPPADVPDDLADGPTNKDAISSDGDAGSSPDDQADQISSDADSGPPPSDVAPDIVRQDTLPDLRPDLPPDLGPDASPLLSGLLVYYKCEAATGTTLQDFSGNKHDGTLSGQTSGYSFPSGKVGKALALAKAGQGYLSMPASAFANVTDITIATWVNATTSQSWQRVFDIGVNAKLAANTSTGTHYLNLVPKNAGTDLAFSMTTNGYSNEQVLIAPALTTGVWKHVAVVLGSGQSNLYVDGALVQNSATISLRPTDLGTIDYAYLGKSQFTNDPYFDGQIDEFRIYGRALSAAEIQALYQYAGP
jgi:hypothetical protein